MANKHEIQRDFERKKKEWKEDLKVKHAIKIGDDFKNFKIEKTNIKDEQQSEEYKKITEEANKRIEESHRINETAIKGMQELYRSSSTAEER